MDDGWQSCLLPNLTQLNSTLLCVGCTCTQVANKEHILPGAAAGDLDTVSTTLLQALRTTFVWMVCLLLRVSPLGGANSSSSGSGGGGGGVPGLTWGGRHPAAYETGVLGSSSSSVQLGLGGAAAGASQWPLAHQAAAVYQYSPQPLPAAGAPGYRIPQLYSLQQQQGPAAAAAGGGHQGAVPWLGWLLGLWQHIGSTYDANNTYSSSSSGLGLGLPDGMQLGEPWGAWSLLQGLGFALMVAGGWTVGGGGGGGHEHLGATAALYLLKRVQHGLDRAA
jgi:hypothetical protein